MSLSRINHRGFPPPLYSHGNSTSLCCGYSVPHSASGRARHIVAKSRRYGVRFPVLQKIYCSFDVNTPGRIIWSICCWTTSTARVETFRELMSLFMPCNKAERDKKNIYRKINNLKSLQLHHSFRLAYPNVRQPKANHSHTINTGHHRPRACIHSQQQLTAAPRNRWCAGWRGGAVLPSILDFRVRAASEGMEVASKMSALIRERWVLPLGIGIGIELGITDRVGIGVKIGKNEC